MPPLYVITSVFNPWRYQSRITLFNRFKKYVQDSGGQLFVVELALGDRPFIATTGAPNELQLRTDHELWHKERMLNLAVHRLPHDWKYMAWIDADLEFARPDWVEETVELLQHFSVIQLFSHAVNLAPDYSILDSRPRKSFISAYLDDEPLCGGYYGMPHPGFAWAMRRDAFDALGGLLDTAILGSADLHMARALVGDVACGLPKGISPGYTETLQLWQGRAEKHIRRNIGAMPGAVFHYWHGRRKDRKYNERWQILVNNQYDPEFDLKPDWQGLWQFTDRCPKLRYDIRQYFATRNEDTIEVR